MMRPTEAASPRPPSWAIEHTEFSAGVLGETAPAVAGRAFARMLETPTGSGQGAKVVVGPMVPIGR